MYIWFYDRNYQKLFLIFVLNNKNNKVLVGRPKGKGQLGRQGHRWEDNIKMDFEDIW
jgi:hypothetical protein